MKKTNTAEKKPENPWISLLVNIVIPVSILSFLSKEKYLGPLWAMVTGLAFPIGYGLRKLARERKADILSIIGIISVTLTGTFGLLELSPKWIAVKEAAIPLLLGLLIVGSLKTRRPLIKTLLMTEALFDVERLKAALKEKGNEEEFEKRLVGLTWGFASAMFVSAILGYLTARLVVHSQPGTEAFTAELGKMTGLSHLVVLVPSMIIMFIVLNRLFDTLIELTGLDLEELIAPHHRKPKKDEKAKKGKSTQAEK